MAVYELKPVSIGPDFSAEWFDDEKCVWNDERLRCPVSLVHDWKTPKLKLHRAGRAPTAVLFNPNAFAVSQGVRERLSGFEELEFLPVEIEGHGNYFIPHIIASCEVPEGSQVSRPEPPVNGNIVQIKAFPANFEPTAAFFRILQPRNSPAGRKGRSVLAQYANARGAQAMVSVAGQYICTHEVPLA
ncbi:hypothetical protein [Niveibacterium microcysteis]|uniref:Uncharacterized protein n=1 Tax=Niveibacterium microcysteis TaxID=2811415 RepID=A0ABX7M4G6_9RHOO|nr:hypothetical protein [Niveibacterium microcysteis]QSI76644.1 hypothetical protein JY500_19635 [Niveibacterium microcysteis]